jgi:hypothetical protein
MSMLNLLTLKILQVFFLRSSNGYREKWWHFSSKALMIILAAA